MYSSSWVIRSLNEFVVMVGGVDFYRVSGMIICISFCWRLKPELAFVMASH